jgi:predicted phosphate transport protein (TIGR00153 family)
LRLRFIPQEARFYDEFNTMAARVQDGARLLREMLAADTADFGKAEQIRAVENNCDEITHQIIQRLNKTFVTPLDREDIHALAGRLDDVMDAIEAAATLFPLYDLHAIRHGAAELGDLIARQADQIRLAVEALEKKHGVAERIVEIHTLEHQADLLHAQSVRQLFKEERDPIVVIQWKELFDLLEAATDAAEAVADVLEGIVLKHS